MMNKGDILEMIEHFGFGLYVDYDQWGVDGKGWVRIQTTKFPEMEPLILYADESRETTSRRIGQHLFKMGQQSIKTSLSKLLNT